MDELRADFRQYYGLDADDMGRGYTMLHAASLVVMLPAGSRVMAALDPATVWGLDQQLMAATANAVRYLLWAQAGGGSPKPEPIGPPERGRSDIEAVEADDYVSELKRLRGGGDGD